MNSSRQGEAAAPQKPQGQAPPSALVDRAQESDGFARRTRRIKRRRPKVPIAIRQTPTRTRTGVSSPGPVRASPEEPPPVFPVEEGLLTTAATGDVVVVVGAGAG